MIVNIYDAKENDAEIISDIHALSWKEAYQNIIPQRYLDELENDFWVSSFENWIRNNILKVKLIYENDVPVGCIAYSRSRDEKLCDWGEIISLYINPKYFKKGYGQKLLEVALMDMKKQGYLNCYLWVLKENKRAQYFYEKNGFKSSKDEYKFKIMSKELIDIRYVIELDKYK